MSWAQVLRRGNSPVHDDPTTAPSSSSNNIPSTSTPPAKPVSPSEGPAVAAGKNKKKNNKKKKSVSPENNGNNKASLVGFRLTPVQNPSSSSSAAALAPLRLTPAKPQNNKRQTANYEEEHEGQQQQQQQSASNTKKQKNKKHKHEQNSSSSSSSSNRPKIIYTAQELRSIKNSVTQSPPITPPLGPSSAPKNYQNSNNSNSNNNFSLASSSAASSSATSAASSSSSSSLTRAATSSSSGSNSNNNNNNNNNDRASSHAGHALLLETTEKLLLSAPFIVSDFAADALRRDVLRKEQFPFECHECSAVNLNEIECCGVTGFKAPPAGACHQMSELIKASLKQARTSGLTFIVQSPDVVFNQIRLAVVFGDSTTPGAACLIKVERIRHNNNNNPNSSSSSSKKKSKGQKVIAHVRKPAFPKKIVDCVRDYLLPAGFHLQPPALNNNDAWTTFSNALKFDLIMDNQTPLFCEVSRFWKKSTTSFEKFAHFLFWRDEPQRPLAVNLVQHFQMPVMVALMTGSIDASILLMHLNFYVLSDDVIWNMPFMQNVEPLKSSVLRHCARYFFRKQTERFFAMMIGFKKG